MSTAIDAPREEVSKYAPKIVTIKVDEIKLKMLSVQTVK